MTTLASSYDVIVVGSGMAGFCAALTALEKGLRVVVLEREDRPGGTTRISDGVFNSYDPKRQIKSKVEDSPEKHLKDVLRCGRYRNHARLAEAFCYEAYPTLSWLESMGFPFEPHIGQAKGASFPRSHYPKTDKLKSRGEAYIQFFVTESQKRELHLDCSTLVIDLLWDPDLHRVSGVVVNQKGKIHKLFARRGVVLTHGGYQSNPTLLNRYSPLLKNVGCNGASGCRGELLAKASDLGAEIIHTGYYVWDILSSHSRLLTHPEQFILVDSTGHRFCREDFQFDALGERILSLPDKQAWVVSSKIQTSDPIPFTSEAIAQTVTDYNRMVALGEDMLFGKANAFLAPLTGRLGFSKVSCVVITTLGGLLIDDRGRVLNRKGKPIPGLFAAGDSVGGIFGCWSATGDNLTAAAVFGRLAAQTLSITKS